MVTPQYILKCRVVYGCGVAVVCLAFGRRLADLWATVILVRTVDSRESTSSLPLAMQRSLTVSVFTGHRARSAFALKLHYFDSNQSVNF